MPHSSETRQKVLQLCKLNLQSALPTTCTLRKNVEDQLCSIEDLAREQIFQVATLSRRKFVIKNNRGHLLILTRILDGLRFAAADIVRSGRSRQFLRDCVDHFRTRRTRQFSQFVERILQVPLRDAVLFQANQERALLCFLRTRFDHPFYANREPLWRSECCRSRILASL